MRVLITGGCGYVGQWLTKFLLERGQLDNGNGPTDIQEIVLFDFVEPPLWLPGLQDKVTVVTGDLAAKELPDGQFDSVFHLASVVSGDGEVNFDKAISVNLEGTRYLLETLRHADNNPRLVFASTIAVFCGPDVLDVEQLGDSTKHLPLTTYGTTKAISELLINDYTRKGFFDGRSARLPTVIVRAGKPNKAASSFCSGVIREPLAGVDSVLPVERSQPMPITSYRAVVQGLIDLHELPSEKLGHDRAVGLPAINVTAGDLVDTTNRLREKRDGMGKVVEEIDSVIAGICKTWPLAIDNTRAQKLGITMPPDLDTMASEYIADFVDVD